MKKTPATTRQKWLQIAPLLGGIFLLTVAVGIIAFPFISNAYYKYYNEREAEEYLQAVERTESTTLQDALALAQAYNAALAEGKELPAEYEDVLNLSGTGLMGYVEIPKLSLSLPIRHGAEYSTLETAVGHLSGTALPVGGKGTHCVLTGHSGMASQRLFSDLDEMEIGDIFYLKILNEIFCYEVDDITVIWPYELEYLSAIPNEDHCTLVTCTPFGVNTHRLLVRGIRVELPAEEDEKNENVDNKDPAASASSSTWLRKYITALVLFTAIPVIIIVIIICVTKMRRKKW